MMLKRFIQWWYKKATCKHEWANFGKPQLHILHYARLYFKKQTLICKRCGATKTVKL